jgi:hypothetical protein
MDSFPRVKRSESETDHSPPSGAEVKDGLTITPLPHMSSCIAGCLINYEHGELQYRTKSKCIYNIQYNNIGSLYIVTYRGNATRN